MHGVHKFVATIQVSLLDIWHSSFNALSLAFRWDKKICDIAIIQSLCYVKVDL